VSILPKCSGKVVCVTSKQCLGDDFSAASDLTCVVLRSIEDRRVESIGDIVTYVTCGSIGERYENDVLLEGLVGWKERRCKENALIYIVANDDFQRLVVASVEEKCAR
jgi:hypothetical protein